MDLVTGNPIKPVLVEVMMTIITPRSSLGVCFINRAKKNAMKGATTKYPRDNPNTRSVFGRVSLSRVFDAKEDRIIQGQITKTRRFTKGPSDEFGSMPFLLQKNPTATTANITIIFEKTVNIYIVCLLL